MVGQCGAIEVILGVMKAHIKSADVCKQGSGVLKNVIPVNCRILFKYLKRNWYL